MNYWLLKTEPDDYSYTNLAEAGQDVWDGVRSRQAQNNFRKMSPGDLTFIYHTGKEKAIVGVARIVSAAIPDPTDDTWQAVRVEARHPLTRPVTLKEIKEAPQFSDWALVRQPRLSVMPVTPAHWQAVLKLSAS